MIFDIVPKRCSDRKSMVHFDPLILGWVSATQPTSRSRSSAQNEHMKLSYLFDNLKVKVGWTSRVQPTKLFCFVLAHNFYHESRTKFESILKDSCFAEAHVLAPAIVELFEDLFLLIGEAFLEVLVVPRHIAEQDFLQTIQRPYQDEEGKLRYECKRCKVTMVRSYKNRRSEVLELKLPKEKSKVPCFVGVL